MDAALFEVKNLRQQSTKIDTRTKNTINFWMEQPLGQSFILSQLFDNFSLFREFNEKLCIHRKLLWTKDKGKTKY